MLVYGDHRWITNLHYAFQDDSYLVNDFTYTEFMIFYSTCVCTHLGDGTAWFV